jgi:hypothetical protein
MNTLMTVISLVMGVSSFIGGIILWYKGSVEKSYAAQRDFGHLKRNYENLSNAINILIEQVEVVEKDAALGKDTARDVYREVNELNCSMVEAKALILAISNRMEGLAARVV